ncbi:helix-turn-helix domain-containing protein [Spirillospora sp. CA-294931]|uniref:helix-turn-helix domain-containing protein n=1 Tax=Spirillospora sp. CA-294931 TaxID=3240042 RepID=UPI003D8C7683
MRTRRGFDPDSDLWDFIAFELRRQRQEQDLSLAAVGDIIGRDRSLVARVESGETKLQVAHADRLDRAWSGGGFFRRMVNFAKAGHDVEWFKTHLELEAIASELRIWELGWIPGLFQTEAYARAMFEVAGVEDMEKPLAARLARQTSLTRSPRPLVWVFLDQGVIDQPVGGPEVMREQLSKLLDLARLPNITVRIMPRSVGAHVGRDGSFKIMTVAGADHIYTEACEGGRLTADSTDVGLFRVRFSRIGDWALPVDASLRLIQEVLETL